MTKHLIVILGPTAIGKTKLSITLAQHFNTVILSCDSRQFFKEMTIGTAVPSKEELKQAEHYFIQNKTIFEPYNVGQFERDALVQLDSIFKTKDIAIMVGGSGLYVDAVLNGLDYFPDLDPAIRTQLNDTLKISGLETLQMQLKELDPISYQNIEIENPHRVIRALEICLGTGKSYSSFKQKPKEVRPFTPLLIGLTAPREVLYNRINQRVDLMIQDGLVSEARELHKYKDLNALQTVGYRELFGHIDGDYNLETAIEEIKKNTRRFAKRQGTWFRKNTSINWFDFDNTEGIIPFVEQKINSNDL
ncbi:MAG: tRNA (adenosine(37)-N6)-dimethylallyltransferase MiaA [Flavobacteriales bacterium]|jgi:tRNA dimethylallyltransferase|nr:tRNA (adenosine(37)-N6)-dimethylallyltransferase MiaA [Flavobacteriales bacterium]